LDTANTLDRTLIGAVTGFLVLLVIASIGIIQLCKIVKKHTGNAARRKRVMLVVIVMTAIYCGMGTHKARRHSTKLGKLVIQEQERTLGQDASNGTVLDSFALVVNHGIHLGIRLDQSLGFLAGTHQLVLVKVTGNRGKMGWFIPDILLVAPLPNFVHVIFPNFDRIRFFEGSRSWG
jgi:hypothetical protein